MLPGYAHQPPAPPALTQASWQSAEPGMQPEHPSSTHEQHAPGSTLPGAPHEPASYPVPWHASAHDQPAGTQAVHPPPLAGATPPGNAAAMRLRFHVATEAPPYHDSRLTTHDLP